LTSIMREFVGKDERQWPSCQVRNELIEYYRTDGFGVTVDPVDNITLKVVDNEDDDVDEPAVELKESDQ